MSDSTYISAERAADKVFFNINVDLCVIVIALTLS